MLRQELAAFIEKNLLGEGPGASVDEATQLIEGGILDSMGLMQVVGFIEERTGVKVPDDEVAPDNFETVVAIESLVDRLRSRRESR
jgi:acyl carrier protein